MVAKRDVIRMLVLSGATAAVLIYLAWIFGWARTVSLPSEHQFAPVGLVWRAGLVFGGHILLLFYWILALAGLLASGLAIALMRRRSADRYVTDLSSALSAGAVAASWLYYVRVFDEYGVALHPDSAWVIAVDTLAVGLAVLTIVWLSRFIAHYPVQITFERLLQCKYPNLAQQGRVVRWSWPAERMMLRIVSMLQRLVARCCHLLHLRGLERWFDVHARLLRVQIGEVVASNDDVVELDREMRNSLLGRGWVVAGGAIGIAVGLTWHFAVTQRRLRLGLVMLASTLGMLCLCVASQQMSYRYRYGLPEHRRQIEWIAWGGVVAILMYLVPNVAAVLFDSITDSLGQRMPFEIALGKYWVVAVPALAVAPMAGAIMLAIALSVFYRGSIDPGLALRRTTVYTVLAVLLSTLFVALEGFASIGVVTSLGLSSQSGALIAGSIVALVFNPVRHRVENGVERLVSRLRPAELLAEGKRYVAAVMFSDLSGYTALSSRDEKAALTIAALFHKEARRAAEGSGGRLVKTIGDAALTVYPDSAAALTALARLHERYRIGAELLELPLLPIHSGIHSGEVVEAPDGDVFGATVNLAARLEGQAQGGQAVVSEAAAVSARNAHIELHPLGERRLKNVDEPVLCSIWVPETRPLAPATDEAPAASVVTGALPSLAKP
jgi:class 3 adenylate cyclase